MLTQLRLKELLSYDQQTGVFVNVRSGSGRKPVGTAAGSHNSTGYIASMIDGKNYLHHRLAWLFVHGVFPPADIDHRDGVRDNNAIENLRLAERSENCQNMARRRDNSSGATGVRKVGAKWRANISIGKVHHHVGYFATREQACQARDEAKAAHHKFQPISRPNI